jgi:DNA-binding IclR family transcriptional regulator
MDEQVIAALIGVMETLWRIEGERPDKTCTLARLSKQAGLPMSVLRRQLTALVDAGWVVLQLDEGSVTGTVTTTAAGAQLCRELFAGDPK